MENAPEHRQRHVGRARSVVIFDPVEQMHDLAALDTAYRPIAERRIDQPPQDRHALVDRAQFPALALQVVFADGGKRVGLSGSRLDLGSFPRCSWVAALGQFVQCVGSALAGSGQRQRRPGTEGQLGRPAVVPVADRPGLGAGWLHNEE